MDLYRCIYIVCCKNSDMKMRYSLNVQGTLRHPMRSNLSMTQLARKSKAPKVLVFFRVVL